MCLMCVAKAVEVCVLGAAAAVTGVAFLKVKYNLHKVSKCDKDGHCGCRCHCSCHQKECGCECHKHYDVVKKEQKKSK